MRVVCCYAPNHLRRGTVESLRGQAPHAEFVDVSSGPDAYFEAFRSLWLAQEDFLLVEHDLVLAPGTVDALEACGEPWCSCHIGHLFTTYKGEAYLQCNRWRREMMIAHPGVVDVPREDRFWGQLDGHLLKRMGGFKPHRHLDLPTLHLAPSIGSSLDHAGMKAWRDANTPEPVMHTYSVGVNLDSAVRPVVPISDGMEALGLASTLTVEVLLVSYNQSRYLQSAIDSVRAQSYSHWHLTVLDNGSTDPQVGRILLAAAADPRIRVQRFHPSAADRASVCGYAALFNYGAWHTESDLIAFLCDDDLYVPDRLARMVAVIEAGRDVAYGAQRLLDGDGQRLGVRATEGVLRDAHSRVDLNSVLLTRSSFTKAGGLPTAPSVWSNADARLWRRLHAEGYDFYPVPGAPTDAKRYRDDSVTARLAKRQVPW